VGGTGKWNGVSNRSRINSSVAVANSAPGSSKVAAAASFAYPQGFELPDRDPSDTPRRGYAGDRTCFPPSCPAKRGVAMGNPEASGANSSAARHPLEAVNAAWLNAPVHPGAVPKKNNLWRHLTTEWI